MEKRRIRKPRNPVKIGERFGRLVIVAEAEPERNKAGHSRRRVVARCDCGTEKIIRNPPALRMGGWLSCGCHQKDTVRSRSYKHGMTVGYKPTAMYTTWQGMLDRCYNPNSEHYHRYGGRGISVCERWYNDAKAFAEDMGDKPTRFHSIDRIDQDGNYCPENCRWADKRQQARNRSTNIIVEHDGRDWVLIDLCEKLGVSYALVCSRKKRGLPQSDWFLPPEDRSEISRRASNNRWNKERAARQSLDTPGNPV